MEVLSSLNPERYLHLGEKRISLTVVGSGIKSDAPYTRAPLDQVRNGCAIVGSPIRDPPVGVRHCREHGRVLGAAECRRYARCRPAGGGIEDVAGYGVAGSHSWSGVSRLRG